MKTSLWEKRNLNNRLCTRFGLSILFRVTFLTFLIVALTGCSVLEAVMKASGPPPTDTSAPIEPPAATAIPDNPTAAPTYTPQPTFTELPTYTPFPTYTLLPTYPPLPTYTSLPSLTPQPYYFQPSPYPTYPYYYPSPYPTYSSYMTGQCCTLRVRNRGTSTYWIGTKLPYGGNFIKPGWYVEFYMHQPTAMWIEYCRAKGYTHMRYNCQRRYVYLDQILQEIGIP